MFVLILSFANQIKKITVKGVGLLAYKNYEVAHPMTGIFVLILSFANQTPIGQQMQSQSIM